MKTSAQACAIRPASPADAPGITRCVNAAYRHYIPRIGKPPGPMLDDFADVIQRHSVFVAESHSEVIGVVVLIDAKSDMLLDNVAVHPAHQGKGVGRCLLELAELEARSRGYSNLMLYTHECMTENITMYQRAGYIERERKTVRGYNRVYMSKALA